MSSRGLNLIEVIVAGALFFLMSTFVLTLLPSAQFASSKIEARLAAEELAHSTLEEIRGSPYSQLEIDQPTRTEVLNRVEFTISVQINDVADRDPELLREVIVETRWRDKSGEHSTRASSYVSAVRR